MNIGDKVQSEAYDTPLPTPSQQNLLQQASLRSSVARPSDNARQDLASPPKSTIELNAVKSTAPDLANTKISKWLPDIENYLVTRNKKPLEPLIQELLDNPETDLGGGYTILHFAGIVGDANLVDAGLNSGIELNQPTDKDNHILLGNGDRVFNIDIELGMALHCADTRSDDHKEVAKMLIDQGAQITHINGNGNSMLNLCKYADLLEKLCQTLDNDGELEAYINEATDRGSTPLHHAIRRRDLPCIQVLVNYGASKSFTAADMKGNTPRSLLQKWINESDSPLKEELETLNETLLSQQA